MDRFTQIALLATMTLLVWWGLEKAGFVGASQDPVAMAQPDLVPVYEQRRQQEQLWFKTGRWHGLT